MALRKIRLCVDPILRKKSKPVQEINAQVHILLEDMRETMKSMNGIGIAAVQIGVLKRIVLIDMSMDDGDRGIIELINPEIIEERGSQECTEGCLSIPGKIGTVIRPDYVKVKAVDRNGEEFVVEAEGREAIPFFHEIDHLNGILYIDKVVSDLEDV